MSEAKQCYIFGLPSAGKTTFLAALWHSLNCSHKHNNKLKLHNIGDTAKYLSDISKKWSDSDPLERTPQSGGKQDISIEVSDSYDNIFHLRMPDLSGEIFQSQYEKREISYDLVEYIRGSDGILLFINADKVISTTYIAEINEGDNDKNNLTVPLNEIQVRIPALHDPMQVQIIELLQFIEEIGQGKIYNLGIILSAWDLVVGLGTEICPDQFIDLNMNMLNQYLFTNKTFTTSIWGVSAQGGTLGDEILLEKDPVDRIIVIDPRCEESHDITLPIFEVLGGANAE